MKPGRIHIGTSGWHYPHWVGHFYPEKMTSDAFLSYYTRNFTTVEINNTFYHLPTPQTLTGWQKGTPKDFLFACKGSRFITHMKKLKEPEQSTQGFFETITALGEKLGPILFQLPPRWNVNISRLEEFLQALPRTFRYAFEFRDQSWFDADIYKVLANHNAAFCLYNLAGQWSPEIVTANFVYTRLHGPHGAYQGCYDGNMIQVWAEKCANWANSGKDVYCYFDNDEKAYATVNALGLQSRVKHIERKRLAHGVVA